MCVFLIIDISKAVFWSRDGVKESGLQGLASSFHEAWELVPESVQKGSSGSGGSVVVVAAVVVVFVVIVIGDSSEDVDEGDNGSGKKSEKESSKWSSGRRRRSVDVARYVARLNCVSAVPVGALGV